jgi:flagellar hook-length control protein FliK
VTASAAPIRFEADVFPARTASVAQASAAAMGVPFAITIPGDLQTIERTVPLAPTQHATAAGDEAVDVPAQIVRAVQLQWRDGVGEAKIRLTPESLGEVTISLRVEQGSVFASVRAESAAAMQAIQARQQELQNALEAQGLHLDHLVLSADPDQQREREQPQHRAPRRALRQQQDGDGTPRFEIVA